MKLISMVDFVLQQYKKAIKQDTDFVSEMVLAWYYANFLNQPLTLGMFVPCDEKGNVLNETNVYHKDRPLNEVEAEYFYNIKTEQYQQAKERVLFEGLIVDEKYLIEVYKTVEDLIQHSPTLTPNAVKQLGL